MFRRLLTVLLLISAVAAAVTTGLAAAVSYALVDARFRLFPRDASGEIVIVAIDPKSIDAVGVWPWPRTVYGELVDKLGQLGTADIVFDIDFSSRSTAEADSAFAAALGRAQGSIVLATFAQKTRDGMRHESAPIPAFLDQAWLAVANVSPARDGLIRDYAYGAKINGAFEPTMGAMLAGVHEPNLLNFDIDYSIQADTIPTISLIDILSDKIPKADLAGKKVIVGATAIELGDRFNVPNGKVLPGPVIQALAAETLVQQRTLAWTTSTVTVFGFVAVSLIFLLIQRVQRISARLIFLICLAGAIELFATYYQVQAGVLVDTATWHIVLIVAVLVTLLEELDLKSLMARVANTRFRHVAETLGEGLVCTDHNGTVIEWNGGATRIFGRLESEMVGRSVLDLVADENTKLVTDILKQGLDVPQNLVVELTGKRASGKPFVLEAGVSCWRHEPTHQFAFVLRDVTERKQEQDRIRFLAEHDPMTNLINRSKLCEELNRQTNTTTPQELHVIHFGVDGLKALNDLLGLDRGDMLLTEVAEALRWIWSDLGQVARINGDEFAVLVPASALSLDEIKSRIEVSQKFSLNIGDRSVHVSLSAGSASSPQDGTTADELLGNAALAVSEAKDQGSGHYVPYKAEYREVIENRRVLEAELKLAYERNEFELFYQPQVSLDDFSIVGAEALIRWRHPSKGLVPPGLFISVLETSAVAADVGRWVVHEAISQAAQWHHVGHDVRIGINLSQAIVDEALPDLVADALSKYDLPVRLVELEVTETIALEDTTQAAEVFRDIQNSGVHIAFDDFGTGFASLTTLKSFPLNRLKIDQTFVRDLTNSKDDHSIVSAMVNLSGLLELHVIAEGIEDEATAVKLRELGCEEGQGYHFGRPVPAEEFFALHLAGAQSQHTPESSLDRPKASCVS